MTRGARSAAKRWVLVVLVLLALMGLHLLTPAPPVVDLGDWHLLVVQSDDWGFEGWTPTLAAAESLAAARRGLADELAVYATSSLESVADVESLSALLASVVDADGLPAVLQANTIVAAIDWAAIVPGSIVVNAPWLPKVGLCLRPSGEGPGAYARPGLIEAVDEAVARGVWHPELHGLTHHDLRAVAEARLRHDPIEAAAARQGTVSYDGWLTRSELASGDPVEASDMASMSCRLFARRFGRRPTSVIASDYQWDGLDEGAWVAEGIRVVQAKREQVDPSLGPGTLAGRVRKAWRRWLDRRRGDLVYLDRHAELEPYGNPDPASLQGLAAAHSQIQQRWREGRAAILSVHRVQLSNLDADVAAAGRSQLETLLNRLADDSGVRFCVDAELAQLRRTGVSVLERGPWLVVRNYTGSSRRVDLGEPGVRVLPPGTHVLPRETARGRLENEAYCLIRNWLRVLTLDVRGAPVLHWLAILIDDATMVAGSAKAPLSAFKWCSASEVVLITTSKCSPSPCGESNSTDG